MARKAKGDEKLPNPEAWLTSYADLVTLLLVFFVVLYAMANTDLKNFQKVALALRAAFNNPSETPITAISDDAGGVTSTSQIANAPIFTENLPPKRRDFVRVSTELTIFAQELDVGGDISINMTLEGIIISLSDRLVFESGSSNLRPEAQELLEKVADILHTTDNMVRVEGHTDNLPTNDEAYPTNWELSVNRAVSIVRYLSEDAGVAPERFSAAGYAEHKPVVPNISRANRSMNRRADIVIIYPGESRQFSLSFADNSQ